MFINLGSNREEFALGLLEQFKNKLHNAVQSSQEKLEKPSETVKEDDDDDDDWYIFKMNKYFYFYKKYTIYIFKHNKYM